MVGFEAVNCGRLPKRFGLLTNGDRVRPLTECENLN